ncbi:hypothetical protein N9L92_00590 [Saprospiraceae bacterium]|nr:hypothetical protein [Saprospiraceae bacterium]
MSSCNKEESVIQENVKEEMCEFEITLDPVCAFDPTLAQEVQFPARVLNNGEVISGPDYSFSWNIDSEFTGSAISVSYGELPLIVTVTEVATDCAVEATLSTTFWD